MGTRMRGPNAVPFEAVRFANGYFISFENWSTKRHDFCKMPNFARKRNWITLCIPIYMGKRGPSTNKWFTHGLQTGT